jgi:hypothetical protein
MFHLELVMQCLLHMLSICRLPAIRGFKVVVIYMLVIIVLELVMVAEMAASSVDLSAAVELVDILARAAKVANPLMRQGFKDMAVVALAAVLLLDSIADVASSFLAALAVVVA